MTKLVSALCTLLSLVQTKSFKIDLEKVAVDASTKRELGHTHSNVLRLTNYFNYQYIGTIFVGSNDQPMKVLFDTGSTWLWLPSSDCPANECARGHYDWR
jgi:hypothetical protein